MKRKDPGELAGARDEDLAFRDAVRDVKPLAAPNRIPPYRTPPSTRPLQRLADEQAVLAELSRMALADSADIEIEDDSLYLRPGLPRDILRKLRRSHWVIQQDLDLHGLTGDEAALECARFLAECKRTGQRCVRIVHGKGLRSKGREPVLKRRIRRLLTRRDEVLAFVEPHAIHGGGGAVLVLLDA